jgi:diamine N-acetyltransferase
MISEVALSNDVIQLRALEPEDLELLYFIENDTSIWRVSNTVAPYSKFVLKQYLEQATQDIYTAKQLRLVIEMADGKEPLGLIDLYDFDPFHKRAGIGIVLKDDYKGQGLAFSAVTLIMSYCKEHLDLHQVYCTMLEDNVVSQKLFEKHGFQHRGSKKDWVRQGDRFLDEHFYQFIF